MMRNGRRQLLLLCDSCRRNRGTKPYYAHADAGIPIEEVPVVRDNRTRLGPTSPRVCVRCRRLGLRVERHHWAPSNIFPDAECWGTVDLCKTCHTEWHVKMREWAKAKYGPQTSAEYTQADEAT
jgi:hypothetical protein